MYGKCKYKLSENAKYNTIKVDFTEICSAWILLASNGAGELLWILQLTFVFAGGVYDFIFTTLYVPPIVVGRKTMRTVSVLALNDGVCGTAEISIYM